MTANDNWKRLDAAWTRAEITLNRKMTPDEIQVFLRLFCSGRYADEVAILEQMEADGVLAQ